MSRLLDEIARAPTPDLAAWGRALEPGEVVGRFEIVREIGRGGFGVVYEARDLELQRPVAFKAVKPSRARGEISDELLRAEAEAAAQLNHPNIVTLHDIGTDRGRPFLILELLRGETFHARLARGPLPPREAVTIAVQLGRALAHAHAAGVIHRDLTPGNVFLCRDGAAKVLDFGLARIFGSPSLAGGTPGYMAPEQMRREGEDARTDVFSAAVMLYESLSGRRPWEPKEGQRDPFGAGPPPPLKVPGVPAALVRVIARGLSVDPAARPRDGKEWLDELLAAQERVEGRKRRLLVRAGALAGLALAFGGVLAAVRLGWLGPGEEAGPPVTVAVADVENATSEPDLTGLSGLLITSLEQSRRLSVLTRTRMLDLLQQAGHDRVDRIDERLGRDVSRRAGARALLLATVRRFDEVYAIELKAIDPIADAYLFTLKEQGSGKSSIPGLIDRLGEATRRALREQASDVESSRVQLAAVVTPSMEAYRHYFLGVQCIDALALVAECIEHFRRALKVDPTFAMAHYMVAYTAEFRQAGPGEQKAAIAAAIANIDRAPPKERGLILAWNAHLEGKDEEAAGIHRQLVERYPEDPQVAYVAGDLLFHREDCAGALPYFEQALALGSAVPVLRAHVVECLAHLDRGSEGVERAARWAAAQPDADAQQILARAHLLRGDFGAALPAMERAVELGGGWKAQALRADALSLAGRHAEAEAVARRLAAAEGPPEARQSGTLKLVQALTYQGRHREARAELDRMRAEGEGMMRGTGYRAAWLLGEGRSVVPEIERETERLSGAAGTRSAGPLAVALALFGEVEKAKALALRMGAEKDGGLVAVLRWREGDREGAVATLRAQEAKGSAGASYVLGELLAEARRDREAVPTLRAFQGKYFDPWIRCWAYPRSLLLVAASLERLGDRDGARAEVDRLLAIWQRADADLPALAEARALRARLAN